jgi:dienelactone hydrolase
MTRVLLFHHALGVTPGVRAFADHLRAAGHEVTVPDLFDGATFDSVAAGVAHAEGIGFETIAERGTAHADELEPPFVVAGFSLGALPAQKIAQSRRGVTGAVLYHAAVPISAFGDEWPDGVALQIHITEDDPWAAEDLDTARDLAARAGGELHLYPGTGHLVADSGSPDHDPAQARLILERTLAFLADR